MRIVLLFCVFSVGAITARSLQREEVNWYNKFESLPDVIRKPRQQWFPFNRETAVNQPNIFALGDPQLVSGTTATPAVTTASPQFLACVQACPTTMEYNPVCGTDGENYHNNARLQCAVQCGRVVAAVRLGSCQPL